MLILPIKVNVRRHVINRFKKAAKEAFPKETFAFLLGHNAGTLVDVEDLYFPEGIAKLSTVNSVEIPDELVSEARAYAKEEALTIVGDIHSHPFQWAELKRSCTKPESTPSETDLRSGWYHISAICLVCEDSKGRLTASKPRFWGPLVPTFEEII